MLAPEYAALGRLYDPLAQLAENIHLAMSGRRMVVWTDDKGRVFAKDPGYMQSLTSCSIIGTYDAYTSPSIIEADLRIGLRGRARSWILDWNAQNLTQDHNESSRISPTLRPRRRSRKLRTIDDSSAPKALGD